MPNQSITTIDHDEIKKWIMDRGGKPSVIEDNGKTEMLRVDFGENEENLKEISWEKFFDIFEKNKIAFVYQEKTSEDEISRFCKFVSR
jgi:hypothetical protein